MKNKQESKLKAYKSEKGITLVALIITIIILVILSAVSIGVIYKSKIVDYAIEGAQKYAAEGINENKVIEGTEQLIESAISTIKEMGVTGGEIPNPNPTPDPDPEVGKTAEELEKVENIGKYIEYKSEGSNYTIDKAYTEAGSNQTFSANNNMKWRIWGVEGNKLLLISETLAGNIKLKGAAGYNNAVKILNDACSTAFGNSSYGSAIKVRSINQEDIDKVTNMTTPEQRKAVWPSYNYGVSGASMTTPSNNSYYPKIYEQEPSKSGGGTLERSEQSSWCSGNMTGSSIGYYSYYSYNITSYATQTIYDALLTNPTAASTTGEDNHIAYWVASRCVTINNSYALFDVFCVENGNVNAYALYNSDNGYNVPVPAVRPIIEVNLDAITIGETGDGTASNAYSIAKK